MNMDKGLMERSAERASDFLKCLSHPHRLMLICQLLDGPKSVGELAELVGVRSSTMSQHLAQLRLNGLVSARREAQTVRYAVASPAARDLVQVLYSRFCVISSDEGVDK